MTLFLVNSMNFGQKVRKLGLISSDDLFFWGKQHNCRPKIGLCLRISHRVLSATHKILHALPINYPENTRLHDQFLAHQLHDQSQRSRHAPGVWT